MAVMTAHRGPDDRGRYFDESAGLALGHNRLSIIDLSTAGHQPMFSEDQCIVLVFNGEIYNFQELRTELSAAGHTFRSRSDSEVLIHGYEQWGLKLLDRLAGMFAFAIWDQRERTLLLFRDPMGIKPLYYWLDSANGLVFASEIKAFRALPDFAAECDLHSIHQFMEFNFIPDQRRTSLKGVSKLPPGHYLKVTQAELESGENPQPQRYYDCPATEPTDGSDKSADERADLLFDIFSRVVADHLVADVPVGLLLSGGLDSSLIAAVAARHAPVRTISMGFAESGHDERPWGNLVSQHICSQHQEILISPARISDTLANDVWWVDDLFGDWGVISTRLLYGACRDAGIKVVLVGEGSDELFGGYPNFVTAGDNRIGSLTRALRLYRWYSGRRWGRELVTVYFALRELEASVQSSDAFSLVRRFETEYQLPNCYNMKVDKASMSVSVEARVPFLDVRMAREGFRSGAELLLREGTNKHLLRRMARRHRLLPDQVIDRRKVGGSIAASWMDDVPDFRSFAREVVLRSGNWTERLGLNRPMRAYFDDNRESLGFPRRISILSIVAWRLLLLNLWHDRCIAAPV